MSGSPEFHRIISARSFVRLSHIPSLALSVAAALLLFLLLLGVGAISWELIEASRPHRIEDEGLLPLASALENHPIGRLAAIVILSVKPLQRTASAIVVVGVVAVVLFTVRWVLRSLAVALCDRNVAGSVLRLRQHLHRAALRLEPADLTGEQTRHFNELFQASSRAVEFAARRWGQLWLTGFPDLAAAVIAALMTDWKLAVQTTIPLILGRMALQVESRRTDSSIRLLQEQVERGLSRMAEGLMKTRIVTNFGMEQTEQQQFESHLKDYRLRCQHLSRQQRLGSGIRNLLLLIIILVPAVLLIAHILSGDHVAKAVLMACCLFVIYRCIGLMDQMPELSTEGSLQADRIAAQINRIPSVSQVPGASFLEPMSKTLTFNQVVFQTPNLPSLLRGLDLRIQFGERIALLSVHPVPAWALASMIPRFVDPDMGQILIDGRDIRQATLESLRAEVSFVGGNDAVFNATVMDNITCGQPDITRQQAQDAAKLVHADHFIRGLSKGYETVLGERGISLDPGQVFRLSLTRAVVREPALLIIEEPSVVLDAETKAMLDDTYQRISANRTIIFLPHRLSTVKRCSRIVLIHEGKIAVDGTHDQLVRTSELYRHWEYVRFNPFREDAEQAPHAVQHRDRLRE